MCMTPEPNTSGVTECAQEYKVLTRKQGAKIAHISFKSRMTPAYHCVFCVHNFAQTSALSLF